MGRRELRTEDAQEGFDTRIREAVLRLTETRERVPIRLSVVVTAPKPPARFSKRSPPVL
jgi:type IV pilus biogenesis protein CpaD/CtpE